MKQGLKYLYVTLFLFISLIFDNSLANSTTLLQLKNGQKVEGYFKGATSQEIHIEVASRILNFKISEVSHLIFDAESFSNLNDLEPNSFKSAAKKALRSVKALQTLTHAGVNYEDYSKRVNDSNIVVGEFLDVYTESQNKEFNELITDAIGYYNAASLAWSSGISDDEMIICSLPENEYCKKCQELQNVIIKLKNDSKYDVYRKGVRGEGFAIRSFGIQPLWKCAEKAISMAEKLLEN